VSAEPARHTGVPPAHRHHLPLGTTAGSILAALSALSFGMTVVFGRSLAVAGLGAPTVLGIRFSGAALFLFTLILVMRRPLLPAPGERAAAYLLGAVLYMGQSSFFFAGLERGSAAAVSLLSYSYPALVTLLEIPLGAGMPARRTWLALVLSLSGAATLVLAGGRVSISSAGIACALTSALGYSFYMLASHRWLRHSDSLTSAAWVALGAGSSFLLQGIWRGELGGAAGYGPALAGNAAASAAAFGLLFAALRRLGASRTSVMMTLESLSAIVLARLFLGEPVGPLQMAGGAAILLGATLIASGREARAKQPGPRAGA
jgi:drug/metabolite transporter (DMT)-like permease